MKKWTRSFWFFSLLITMPALASVRPDVQFHNLFLSAVGSQSPNAQYLHFDLDSNLRRMLSASTIQQAMTMAAKSSLATLAATTARMPTQTYPVNSILQKTPMTIVVVPGIFGEFIPNRAFEEVLAKQSAWKTKFRAIVSKALSEGRSEAMDHAFSLFDLKHNSMPLDKLVNVASFDGRNGKPYLKVVLLFTPFASLETLVNVRQQAEIFERRLEKYLALTGPQNLILVGYSRGLDSALQMLADAKRKNQSWLKDVRGMVSLGGVTFGSTLADDFETPGTENNKILVATQNFINQLQSYPSDADILTKFNVWWRNSKVWTEYAAFVAKEKLKGATHTSPELESETEAALHELADPSNPREFSFDFSHPLDLFRQFKQMLGLNHFFTGYDQNVVKFKTLIHAVLTGLEELSTGSRLNWWRTHILPTKNIHYYALAASMPDPETSTFEKKLWDNPMSYAAGSFDDAFLQMNHRQYVKLSGVSLNDSQVAVAQVQFLNNVITGLNPAQAPLNASSLGVLGSHHWGLALQVVNPMQNGIRNPFPRAALLKAIAAQVSLDQQASAQ